jgi:hypothetical protein
MSTTLRKFKLNVYDAADLAQVFGQINKKRRDNLLLFLQDQVYFELFERAQELVPLNMTSLIIGSCRLNEHENTGITVQLAHLPFNFDADYSQLKNLRLYCSGSELTEFHNGNELERLELRHLEYQQFARRASSLPKNLARLKTLIVSVQRCTVPPEYDMAREKISTLYDGFQLKDFAADPRLITLKFVRE